ncbi:symmetrical bis(5'-nucleosyl)-tetraphosphatase [Methylococcus sp. EFPC2]|uniref:symmetrical bis(5'-nucleosyl)-tetraphosphatase n=1 Tax=Methylococcus sp. EFPC2 TaxID=2812648 RepID=UPI001966DFC2|nr:symmetrical bis(5'-nucleosyl)-tetraphosphatase [Methylococcus sp. EFPC2]QSA96718.1 symmetrical bis(5'-nucleosyl)-tetraphosphatase [Methylococcus sp. EFPC2]
MATYAIGDIQGCLAELHDLLALIRFDPAQDRLWFTGDLVNRGPDSLETLRFIKGLGGAAAAVLGNHDLHLLAVASGASRVKRKDTFAAVLSAPDRDELLDWLRRLPLLYGDGAFYLIHAGLPPQWSLEDAIRYAGEVENLLSGEAYAEFFPHMYGDLPDCWSDDLRGWDRIRLITNCFTRMRFCTADGRLDLKEKVPLGQQSPGLLPWFRVPGRRSQGTNIVFGHWSALGFHAENGCWGLDTGCLWGGELTALRLDTLERYAVPSRDGGYQKIGD